MQFKQQIVRGFTLIELLVVIVIIGLLVVVVGPNVMKKLSGARSDSAKLQIESFAGILDGYALDIGHYPTSQQGLKALVDDPGGEANWNGPYLRKKTIPNDPWGNPYHYKSPGEHGAYDLYSLGADNSNGGEKENADIVSWE